MWRVFFWRQSCRKLAVPVVLLIQFESLMGCLKFMGIGRKRGTAFRY
jgi:hypothetical protein